MDWWQTILGKSGSAHQIIAVIAVVSLCVGFVSLGVAVMLRGRNRKSSAHIAALEQLNEVALGMVAAPGEITPLLDRLAAAARELLGMSISRISQFDDNGTIRRGVHQFGATRDQSDLLVFRSDPHRQEFLREAKPKYVHNLQDRHVRHWLNSEVLERQGIASLIVLPLIASKQPVGLMVLARTQADRSPPLSESQRRLAELLAAHAAATISNARLYRMMNEALRSHQRLEVQRDIVYRVNTTLQRVASLDEALSRVTELAPGALEVDACIVCLAEDSPPTAGDLTFLDDTMRVAAVTDLPYEFPLRVGMLLRNPIFARLMRRSLPVAIADAQHEQVLRLEGLANMRGIGSILALPLLFRVGRPFGAVLLTRRMLGKFSDDTVKFAEMFASRAAIAIENARLQEQARRDADTKAMLLKELNHRVKNNLSNLIGLLKIGTPPLSAEAQRWLDRVIERIAALARAHELFSGGGEVWLGKMIDTTLDSISAIRPDAVEIDVQLGKNDVVLSAVQTVPAALMFYELVYNAVVHGAGDAGRIEVRVGQPVSGRVMIEVIDAGTSEIGGGGSTTTKSRTAARIHQSTGAGLTIVRGLVARELHGTFDIRANPQGGTTATVVFPLDPPGAMP